MLRAPPSKIQLSYRDLEWHHRRSKMRTQRKERHAADLFRENTNRPYTLGVEVARHAPLSFPMELPEFPAVPEQRTADIQNWANILVGDLSAYDPSFQQLEGNDSSRASVDSDAATTISSEQLSSDDEGVASVPVPIDPNVRAADELEAQLLRSATHSLVDGTSEDPGAQQPNEVSWVGPYRRLAYNERPQRQAPVTFESTYLANTHQALPQYAGSAPPEHPILSRVRHLANTAPLLGSPLRFSEAARACSPERLATQTAFSTVTTIPGGRFGWLRLPDNLVAQNQQASSVTPSIEEPLPSPVREQLESFSPASHAEMRRIHDSLHRSGDSEIPQLGAKSDEGYRASLPAGLNDDPLDAPAASMRDAIPHSSRSIVSPTPNIRRQQMSSEEVSVDSIPLHVPRIRYASPSFCIYDSDNDDDDDYNSFRSFRQRFGPAADPNTPSSDAFGPHQRFVSPDNFSSSEISMLSETGTVLRGGRGEQGESTSPDQTGLPPTTNSSEPCLDFQEAFREIDDTDEETNGDANDTESIHY